MPSRYRRRRVRRPAPAPTPTAAAKPAARDLKAEWESKFKKMPVTYRAQDGNPRDVRTFIFDRSHILEWIVRKYKLKGKTDTETMHKCCLFVQDNIRYVSDDDTHSQSEFWQNPEDTLARGTGDCEDGAILMKSLALIAGVPDWKCKIVAGMVRGGGHAYCTYIYGDRQIIMDWCYWPTRHHPENKKALGEDTRYKEVWFSFNHDHSYSGQSAVYSKGQVSVGVTAMPKLFSKKPDWME